MPRCRSIGHLPRWWYLDADEAIWSFLTQKCQYGRKTTQRRLSLSYGAGSNEQLQDGFGGGPHAFLGRELGCPYIHTTIRVGGHDRRPARLVLAPPCQCRVACVDAVLCRCSSTRVSLPYMADHRRSAVCLRCVLRPAPPFQWAWLVALAQPQPGPDLSRCLARIESDRIQCNQIQVEVLSQTVCT